ncbi:DUF4328 domain-containing protein [Streptomyces sp. NPDC050264]|uniref:DUF4328 domain-containing protein n=1 Tax=Streptomyces sp. NPDC050264 TaxID=3155038 RepID=UPI003439FC18
MLCKRCGKNNALVEDGLCARCADEAFGTLTAAPGSTEQAGVAEPPLPPRVPSAPYDPMARWALLKSPNRHAAVAVALLGLVIAIDLGAIAAGFAEYRFAAGLADGDWSGYDPGKAERLDDLYALAGQAQVIALVVTAIGFIAWFLRVRDNAEVFEPSGQSKARSWVVLGFLVPVVSLWFPRRIALDTWHSSADGLELSRKQGWSGVIDLWWFLWLTNQLVGRFVSRLHDDPGTLGEVKSAMTGAIAGDALDIVSAVAAIIFVRSLTRLQNRKVSVGLRPAAVTA